MTGNTNKCHLTLRKESDTETCVIESLTKIQHLRKIDQHVNFDDYVNFLCKKANENLRALANATPYMGAKKKEAHYEFLSQ